MGCEESKCVLLLGHDSESPRDLSSALPPFSVNAGDAPYSERKTRGSKQLKGLRKGQEDPWKTGALKSHLDLQMTLH